MAEPAVQQLSEALDKLETFGIGSRGPGRPLPQLPPPADDAVIDHLARGLRAAVRIQGLGIAAVSRDCVQGAAQDLRAAVALLEEWVVLN